MPLENTQAPEFDLERTDRLPVLIGTVPGEDVGDDAVRLDYTPAMPSVKTGRATSNGMAAEAPPSADASRFAEGRGAVHGLESGALRSMLEWEQAHSRELQGSLAEKHAASEVAQSRLDEALREAERHQEELRALRNALAARDTAIGRVQRSLAERDAQLSSLQREHAQVVPVLEERSQLTTRLETELQALRASYESLYSELQDAQQSMAALASQLQGGKRELESTRRELDVAKAQAADALDHLRALEWRRELDEMDVGPRGGASSRVSSAALQEECDRLAAQAAETGAQLAARDETIAKLKSAAVDVEAQRSRELQSAAEADAVARANNAALQEECNRLADVMARANNAALQEQCAWLGARVAEIEAKLAERDEVIADLMSAAMDAEAQRNKELRLAAEAAQAAEAARLELSAEAKRLQVEAQRRDDENALLRARLEAHGPAESSAPAGGRLTNALAAQKRALEPVSEDNRSGRAAEERVPTSLDGHELPIRRLECGDAGAVEAAPTECSAELVRIDGQHEIAHALARRTRIGRAPACELRIESTSVSRHHALLLVDSREAIIEDLNSKNGVIVNGRRISRQALKDGDILTLGEAQFRLNLKPSSEPASRG